MLSLIHICVFGGIIVGLGVAALHNRFYTIELPSALAFFSGSRFVPIISTVVYVPVSYTHLDVYKRQALKS